MAFWDYIFNKIEPEEGPEITFGRFSDAYKDQSQYDAWDKSLHAFEEEQYLKSIRYFFEYLNDSSAQNATWWEEDGRFHFQVFQGSKKITGFADKNRLRSEARIAQGNELNVGLLRRLIEQNYALKYSRYAIDDDDYISLVFDTFLLDGSPYKLYYAIKEIATHADKQDDLLVAEFEQLQPINTGHLRQISETEKKIKYRFFKQELKKLIDLIEAKKGVARNFPEAMGYTLLAFCYKLDYLIAPEGVIMETFERINRQYLAKDNRNQLQKIAKVKKDIDFLYAITEDQFNQELYKTISTFGIASPVNQHQIKNLIESEIEKLDWFQEGKFDDFRLAVPGYIFGYGLFNYAPPEPIRDLFHLYYRITENKYFLELGFTQSYLQEDGSINKKLIRGNLKKLLDKYEKKYPFLDLDDDELNYNSMHGFLKSYLGIIAKLDFTKPQG